MITDRERQKALDLLERTRQDLLDAVQGVSETQAHWSPGPERWSILEYVEHLALSDTGIVDLVESILDTPPKPETPEDRRERERKIRATENPRGANHAPESLRPKARFHTLAEAVAAFLAARERTIQFASATQADLRSHFAPHDLFGKFDAYQWMTGNGHHSMMHAGHIREIRTLPDFPAH